MATALSALALAACGGSGSGTGASSSRPALGEGSASAPARSASGPPCGRAAREVFAASVGLVARRIYKRELDGPGVRADRRQVETYAPLLKALGGGSRAAVRAAVTSLVYSHTHVVRLRVTRSAAVLADVGGPYILAPVAGVLSLGGRTVGHYLLSVQDDLGYVKLETRLIGVPLVLYRGSERVPLEGTVTASSASIPVHGSVAYGGASYDVYSFTAQAFPRGRLRISLLVPASGSAAGESCEQIKLAELDAIAERIWRRFRLAGAPPAQYVQSIRSLTGGLAYVRVGSRQIAGITEPGPPRLPTEGTVSYRGVRYAVTSYLADTAAGRARFYQLLVP